jgi:hypothetical protein
MHEVRSKLKCTSKNPEEVLSKQILEKCKGTEFWRIIESDNEETEEETEFIGA